MAAPTRYFTLLALLISSSVASAEPLSFNRDIRPILSENCFTCHGFDKNSRKAKLRLDLRDESAAEVLELDSDGMSELVARIISDDPDEIMPPPKTKTKLTAEQIALLKQWVAEGGKYESHWAWIPPQKPQLGGQGHPIDQLVAGRLKAEGLGPSPAAEDFRLVRRLYQDLTGLPPTAAQTAAFSKDKYEQTVDALLASSHFGEKWAIMWLDLARYADTVGYHGDQPVSVSPYRDYVIRAFNSNKPYDQFTREQIAGDLMPGATEEQRVATGFNRLNMTTEEGGSQPKEYLAKYAGDRVRTTSTVFMGATLGCAECHDHKFDPYTTKDFYSFAAFFADIEEVGVYSNRGRPPEMVVTPPQALEERAKVEQQLAESEAALEKDPADLAEGRASWYRKVTKALADQQAFDFVWLEDAPPAGAKLSPGWNPVKEGVASGSVAWRQDAGGAKGVQHYFNLAKEPVTLGEGDVFFFNVKLDAKKTPEEIMFQVHSKDHGGWEHRAFWGADKIPYGGVGTKGPNHRPMGALPKPGEWVRLEVPAAELGFKPGQKIDGFSFDQFGGVAWWDQAGVRTRGGSPETRGLPANVLAALKKPANGWTDADRKLVADHYRSIAPELKPQRDQIAALKKRLEELSKQGTKTLITVSKEPRMMRVLPRGNWLDDSGEVVQPAVPEFLAQAGGVRKPAEGERLTRMDLADWLVSPENPLTSRVFVNRVWKQLFGTGISKVLDDVGSQGEWPVHPELLDWLAVDFVESGWDVKRLIKTIVMSQTYQQSSRPRADLRDLDPYNRLLARQSSFRLDAELVRDQFLAVSGQLVPELGGPSVYPYQPAGLYRHLNFPRRTYKASTDQNQWRRGVYTHWQRTFLHPMLKAFDAPSRDECAADRPRSNTPIQALALLNDPSQVESARAFAGRIVSESQGDFATRLTWAYQQALNRPPSAAEVGVLQPLFEAHLAKFKADPQSANDYLSVGFSKVGSMPDKAEHAAWMSVARAIFNLHEMITRY